MAKPHMLKPVLVTGVVKPHIFKRDGWWRVSPMAEPYSYHRDVWLKACRYIHRHNNKSGKSIIKCVD